MKRFLAFLCLPLYLQATEYAPWYDGALQLHWRNTYLYQNFSKVATSQRHKNYNSNDHFFTSALSANYDVYAAELEVVTAATRHRSFGWDNLRLTGRYQFTSEDIGDDFSSAGGLMISRAWKCAVHDIGSFHHGRLEAEAHVAFGKQLLCENFWTSRFWGLLAIGTADTGSPWYRVDFHWDRNYWDFHQYGCLIQTLWGGGGNSLSIPHFKGYGSLRHQSVDLGLYYSYFIECWGATLKGEYTYRIYAKNFPRATNRLLISFFYPLSF